MFTAYNSLDLDAVVSGSVFHTDGTVCVCRAGCIGGSEGFGVLCDEVVDTSFAPLCGHPVFYYGVGIELLRGVAIQYRS